MNPPLVVVGWLDHKGNEVRSVGYMTREQGAMRLALHNNGCEGTLFNGDILYILEPTGMRRYEEHPPSDPMTIGEFNALMKEENPDPDLIDRAYRIFCNTVWAKPARAETTQPSECSGEPTGATAIVSGMGDSPTDEIKDDSLWTTDCNRHGPISQEYQYIDKRSKTELGRVFGYCPKCYRSIALTCSKTEFYPKQD